jgi:outer membrane biosynthesis protein TonB
MEASRKQRRKQLRSVLEPGFNRMLLISLLLHLLLPIIYHAPFFPKSQVEKPPVYRVNLVNKIVKNPQAGRPEATTEKAEPAPKPKATTTPVVPKPVTPKPEAVKIPPKVEKKPEPVKKEPVKTEPKKVETAVKVEPKPTPKPQPSGPTKAAEDSLQQRLEQLQAAQERKAQDQARADRLAALRANVARETAQIESPVKDAPVGEIGGKGDEAGISAMSHVREYIQQQWSFSKYQAVGNPEAEVWLRYSQKGERIGFKFVKMSGNQAFDESLTRAITKAQQLPQELPEAMDFEVIFNLKDMLGSQ